MTAENAAGSDTLDFEFEVKGVSSTNAQVAILLPGLLTEREYGGMSLDSGVGMENTLKLAVAIHLKGSRIKRWSKSCELVNSTSDRNDLGECKVSDSVFQSYGYEVSASANMSLFRIAICGGDCQENVQLKTKPSSRQFEQVWNTLSAQRLPR